MHYLRIIFIKKLPSKQALQDSYRKGFPDIDTYKEVIEENGDLNYIDTQGQMGMRQPQNENHVAENEPQSSNSFLIIIINNFSDNYCQLFLINLIRSGYVSESRLYVVL